MNNKWFWFSQERPALTWRRYWSLWFSMPVWAKVLDVVVDLTVLSVVVLVIWFCVR